MAVAGAAIEKADRILDSLTFYEMFLKGEASTDEIRIARTRWVQCKLRQAKLADERGRREDASRYAKEAEDFRQHYRLNSDAPEYPQISDTDQPGVPVPAPKLSRPMRTNERQLSDRQRRMIIASFKGGMRPEEIAAELELEIETVQTILQSEKP